MLGIDERTCSYTIVKMYEWVAGRTTQADRWASIAEKWPLASASRDPSVAWVVVLASATTGLRVGIHLSKKLTIPGAFSPGSRRW